MTQPARGAISPGGRAYVAAVGALGTAVFAYCAWTLSHRGVASASQFLFFAGLTFASGRLTVKVPSVAARFSVSEMFAFTSVLLFGPETGAVTLALDSLVLSWRHRMSREQAFFNFGNLSLAVWISGTLFFLSAGVAPLYSQVAPVQELLIPLALLATAYFGINSGLIAIAISFQSGGRPYQIWRSNFIWLGPGYATGASVALLVVVALQQFHFSTLALLVPVLLVSYLMLDSSFGRLEDAKQHVEQVDRLYMSTIETLATAIDAKDDVTHNHIRRVQGASLALARELGITDPQLLKAIEAAGLLHDTGKIAVPEHILNKPGRLTPAEFEKMKLHAPIGAEILSAIDFPYPVVPIVRHHHENWDGTGYPDGLKGIDIPIGARILSVVDCYDALTSDRPYRGRMPDDEALRIVLERRGTMYDPLVVDTFARCYRQIMPAADAVVHPAARAVGGARILNAVEAPAVPDGAAGGPAALDELVAFTSLSRALGGTATCADVGALAWLLVKQVVPCDALALYAYEEASDMMVARHAAGQHAEVWRRNRYAMSLGAVGWSAVNRQSLLNAEPLLEAAVSPEQFPPPHVMCTIPLVHQGGLVAVLAVYAPKWMPFSERHLQLLELLAPQLAASLASLPPEASGASPHTKGRRTGVSELQLVRGGRRRLAAGV
ncbi:MAG TPA: HD domain-containing phosphohydrolase [Vicinamibacterales bacterium]